MSHVCQWGFEKVVGLLWCCTNVYNQINPLYVIPSEENRKAVCKVELLRVERSEQAESKKHFVFPQGYGLKSRWLSKRNVTFTVVSHPNSKPYPFVALLLGFAPLFTPQNFDCANRYAVFFAQNDRLTVIFA